MLKMLVVKGLVLAQIFIVIKAYKYAFTLQDEDIFSPCDEPNVYFFDRYIDRSNAITEMLSNGSVYAKGDAIMLMNLGEQNIKFSFQLFKKTRGKWVNTIYAMSREDACSTLFDRNEIWSEYIQYVAEDQRKCPFFEGQTFTFDTMGSLKIDLPDPRMDGEYMGQIMLYMDEINEVMCVNVKADVNRENE